jgi:hypothetical protein
MQYYYIKFNFFIKIFKAKMSGFKIALYLSGLNFPCKDACSSYLEVKYAEDKTKTGFKQFQLFMIV